MDKKWPVTRADDTEGCEWVQCGNCNATDFHSVGCPRITWYEENTPTDDPVLRAALVARVLRKRAIWAHAIGICVWVHRNDENQKPDGDHAMVWEQQSKMTPVQIANVIQAIEADCVMRWAGDK